MIDDRTPNFNLPLPNPQNLLTEDVTRISSSISAIDTALNTQSEQLSQSITNNNQTIVDAAQQTAIELNKIKIFALAGL